MKSNKLKSLVIISFLILLLISLVQNQTSNDVSIDSIRIYTDYTTLTSQANRYGFDFVSKIKIIVDSAVKAMRTLIMVPQYDTNLIIKYCDISISSDVTITTSGLPVDLIIFPYIIDSSDSKYGKIDVFGVHCSLDENTNRPNAGIIGINQNIDLSLTNWLEYYQIEVLHSLTHIMVFNPQDLFNKFIDSEGKVISLSKTLSQLLDSENKYQVISPRVVATAKAYFKCNDITGIPLESFGVTDPSIPSNHWDSRYMHTDLMTAEKSSRKVLSEITLALFEDSGWYKARYYTGGLFRYAKKASCLFFETKCIVDNYPSFYDVFCIINNSGMCDVNRLERGLCEFYQFENEETLKSSIPEEYQYFTEKKLGGFPLLDYCPTSMPFKGKKSYFAGNCNIGESLFPIGLLDSISKTSNCFMSSLNPIGSNRNDDFIDKLNPLCYGVVCDFDNYKYKVLLDSINFIWVPEEGGNFSLSGFLGELQAPPFSNICTNKEECRDLFSCINANSVSIYGSGDKDIPTKYNAQKLVNVFTSSDSYTNAVIVRSDETLIPDDNIVSNYENISESTKDIVIFVDSTNNNGGFYIVRDALNIFCLIALNFLIIN